MTDPQAAFLRHLAVERNASAHTLRSYANDLTDFQSFLAARGTPDLTAADLRLVRAWLAALHARGLAPASIARRLAAVRSCYRFLVRRGVVEGNPAREARSPRQPRKLVTFLPIDEATQLVEGRAVGGASQAPGEQPAQQPGPLAPAVEQQPAVGAGVAAISARPTRAEGAARGRFRRR